MKSIFLSQLKIWLKPSRLIPMLTILGAGAGIILSLLKILRLTTAEEIIISLLALLSVDALNERISTLEKIETQLSRISTGEPLKRRIEILTPVEHAKQASEIWINVIHGTSVIFPNASFYEEKLKNGCNIKVIVLNPNSSSVSTWSLLAKHTHTKQYINSTLECLNGLMSLKTKGKCEVRLSNVFLPFSIFAVDPRKETGSMIVEYHSYKISIDDRPHVRLTMADSHYWFGYYRRQFEQHWSDATIWNP